MHVSVESKAGAVLCLPVAVADDANMVLSPLRKSWLSEFVRSTMVSCLVSLKAVAALHDHWFVAHKPTTVFMECC